MSSTVLLKKLLPFGSRIEIKMFPTITAITTKPTMPKGIRGVVVAGNDTNEGTKRAVRKI